MPIYRLSVPEGHPMPEGVDPIEEIGRLLVARSGVLVALRPGEYDLTPEIWTQHRYDHRLLVHPDHSGAYQLLPRHEDSMIIGTQASSAPGEDMQIDRIRGGTTIRIPEDRVNAFVFGGIPGTSQIGLFELLIHSEESLSI